jgi:hypothetical protein
MSLAASSPVAEAAYVQKVESGLSPGAAFVLALIAFGFSALAALVLKTQWAQLADLGFSGFFVPDAIGLEKSVHLAWTAGWDRIPDIRTFAGTVLVYFPITLWGDTYAALVNVVMLATSASLFCSMLRRIVPRDRLFLTWFVATALVSTNLYIVSSIYFPNKEIPLILLTAVALWGLTYGKWLVAFAAIVLCYWFRDGYALIMGMVLVVALSRRFTFVSGGVIASLFLALLLLSFPISDLSSVDRSLQRNVEIGSRTIGDRFSAFGDMAAYVLRLVGNAFNLGLRPQMADIEGNVYLLGIGYWHFGIILIGGLIWSARNMLSSDIRRSILALAMIVALLGISYGTFVQPRYMMPLIFPLTLGLSESPLGRYVAIAAGLIFPVVFMLSDMLPPLAGF